MTTCLEFDWYEVVRIATGFVLYRGRSLTAAATKLKPGSCYGKGPTRRDAHAQAMAAVRKHQNEVK